VLEIENEVCMKGKIFDINRNRGKEVEWHNKRLDLTVKIHGKSAYSFSY
jgi:hypothetical protein